MGMFSWCCQRCGHPALSPNACDKPINGWMADVVVICKPGPFTTGGFHAGEYDGYGRVGGADLQEDGAAGFSLYHRACWELADKPTAFTEQAKHAPDQGWFFDDGDHDMLDPRETRDMAPEAAAARLATLVAERDGRKRGRRFAEADVKADRGTYRETYRLTVLVPAESMTIPEREARWGCDPVADFKEYGDPYAYYDEA